MIYNRPELMKKGSDTATITITGSSSAAANNNCLCYVEIEGVQYTSEATIAVPKGTQMIACIDSDMGNGQIMLNSEFIAETPYTFYYEVNGNVTVYLSFIRGAISKHTHITTINITEE